MTETRLLSSIYSDFIEATTYDSLPNEVTLEAKRRILDTIGAALVGSTWEFPQTVINYMVELGGKPEATIIQTGTKFPAVNAALANGVCAHALELDDGHRQAHFHPGACVIPSAISAAEMCGAGGKELITAVVVGYEVSIRIGIAINPGQMLRGHHTTGTVGTFGAAAAAGKIMGLSAPEMASAFGIAGLQGAGFFEVTRGGTMVKPMLPGKAAMGGLLAAILSKRGAMGPTTIFEGKAGFLRAMTDELDSNSLTAGLGEVFEICKTYTKFHASCHLTHPSIDAALKICRENDIPPEKMSKVAIATNSLARYNCGDVIHPTTVSVAKFSIPFTVALAIIKGDVSQNRFSEENINDDKIQELAGKVELGVSEAWERLYPDKTGATIKIVTSDGKTYSDSLEFPKGEPENPGTVEDLYGKFHANTTQVLSAEEAVTLRNNIMNLENLPLKDITGLI